MSNNFLQSSEDRRLEDTTAGSVRLAMAFLRPWFHRYVVDDFHTATVTLCALAFNIAQWPGQWWAQAHSELWNLIRAIVLSLAEEVRKAEGVHHSKEVVQLKGVVVELENAIEKYKKELKTRKIRRPARLLMPLLIPPPLHHTPTDTPTDTAWRTSSPLTLERKAKLSPVKTPITPPTSPIGPGLRQSFLPHLDLSVTNPDQDLPAESTLVPAAAINPTPSPLESPDDSEITFIIEPPSSVEPQSSLLFSVLENDQESAQPFVGVLSKDRDDAPVQDMSMGWSHQKKRVVVRQSPTMAETASCLVTGFLIGAFITLCFLSPQRRALLTHLT